MEQQSLRAVHESSLFGAVAVFGFFLGFLGIGLLGSAASRWFWIIIYLTASWLVYCIYRVVRANRSWTKAQPFLLDASKLSNVLEMLELFRIDWGEQLNLELDLELRPTKKFVYGRWAIYKDGEEVDTWLCLKTRLPDRRRLTIKVERIVKKVVTVVRRQKGDRTKLKGTCQDRILLSLSPTAMHSDSSRSHWPVGLGLWNIQEQPESATRRVILLTPRARFGGARRDREIGPEKLANLKRLQAALIVLLRP
jgi:hypothetical protein